MEIKRETEFVEFKESLSQLSRALESLVAMINKHGNAIVYFGVKDNGEIAGVKVGNKTMKDISQAVSERIKPLLVPRITEELYGEKVVIKLQVVLIHLIHLMVIIS